MIKIVIFKSRVNQQNVGRPDGYFKGVMSKFLMAMDVMYRYPDYEWIMFTDDDVNINAGWSGEYLYL